ncbi:TPM domain-containing protein [uncultured Aquitalea sp.]|uniref:TPM domain-containing protein n=1 Tax=uncultured Aquitalea sp. TaxID=540272 RepID=UPI0025E69767|nr:TPM domain-containing protein [uncultured Aquitalea sp.]
MTVLLRVMLLACLAFCCLLARAETAIPPASSPVVDLAGFLQDSDRAALERQLLDFSREKGSQVAVLIVPAIAPETPFDYGARVMDSWKLGRKGVDDGVLLLIVADEHKTQLLVGRGLEGAIPDAYAKRILQDTLKPRLKQNDRLGGIQAAVIQIEGLIKGEALPAPSASANHEPDYGFMIVVCVIAATVGGGVLNGLFGRAVGSFILGAGVVAVTLYLGAMVAFSLAAGVLSVLLSQLIASTGGISWGGGGGGWSGGGSGGGSGGSGWSGGGGGFGGGGASGDW